MIKRIHVSQLKPGMYIHDLNCDWMSHPFLRRHFRVESEADAARIADAGIHEVYIDTARGSDAPGAPSVEEVRRATEQEMLLAATPSPCPNVPLGEEMDRARRLLREAGKIVRETMEDARLGNHVRLEKIEPAVERITESILRNGGALLSLARVKDKDDYTFVHSVSVCVLLVSFGRSVGVAGDDLKHLGIGGLLHDIGKTSIPDAILNKPGPLSEDEFRVMQSHAAESRRILAATPGISLAALQIAGEHHERFDGSGYPGGLKGDAISPLGQMAAICDVYDAITSDRVYHKGMAPAVALRKIFEWGKFHFNPDLVQAFLRTIGVYPVGSLVMLDSGRLAVVVEQHEGNLLNPTVRVVFHSQGNHYLIPEDIDLSRPFGSSGGDRIAGHESPRKWQIDPMRFL
jgi:HD-GYP domain-containing protein (c-di-GMP phosphodiesterase class II)